MQQTEVNGGGGLGGLGLDRTRGVGLREFCWSGSRIVGALKLSGGLGAPWLAFLLWAGLGFVFQEKRGTGLKGLGVLLGSCGPWLSFRSKGFDFLCYLQGFGGF